MGRVATHRVVVVLLAGAVCADHTHAQSSQEIVLVHELRTAFYERAPRSLSTAMSKAVDSWCAAAARESSSEESRPEAWLCRAQELSYFRSVYINGEKGRRGLVCENYDASTFKYFSLDLLAEGVADRTCVPAEFDGEAYELHVQSDSPDGDA
jgi:hypothetical protein